MSKGNFVFSKEREEKTEVEVKGRDREEKTEGEEQRRGDGTLSDLTAAFNTKV